MAKLIGGPEHFYKAGARLARTNGVDTPAQEERKRLRNPAYYRPRGAYRSSGIILFAFIRDNKLGPCASYLVSLGFHDEAAKPKNKRHGCLGLRGTVKKLSRPLTEPV